jgi:hypothetical protein
MNMQDAYDSTTGLAAVHMSIEDLLSFMNDFPALLWRIEIAKSRIEFLNNNYIVSNGLDGKLLLKNIQYQRDVIIPEDAYLLVAFMESVKKGKTAATIFRARCAENRIAWLKITGATNSWDPRYYYGFLLNVTDTVEQIKAILDKDVNIGSLVDDTDNAAVVLDYDSRKVLCCNAGACDLFELNRGELLKLTLNDLYRESMKTAVENMLEQVLLMRKWNGKLDFYQSGKRSFFTAETMVRHMSCGGKRLLRLEFANPKVGRERSRPRRLFSDDSLRVRLMHDLSMVKDDIGSILRVAFKSALVCEKYDAIMFSDVHVRKNQVFVYYAGSQPMPLEQGHRFAYSGTIAEDISRFQLSHLTVEDTQESIKPIDWALFVPQGIRSYFAKPYFSRGALRTVLIVCSRRPHTFSGVTVGDFEDFLDPINEAVKMWRQSGRR